MRNKKQKTQKQIDSNLRNIDSNLDMFELSAQTMRCKSKGGNDIRKKEDAAISQALYMARISDRPGYEYNSTISNIKKQNKNNYLATVKDPIRFSGKHAFEFTFGNSKSLKEQIESELLDPNITKTKAKKLRKQLRETIAKIEFANSIDINAIPREIAIRDINANKSLSALDKIQMIAELA